MAAKHDVVEDLLFNHFRMMAQWQTKPPINCKCKELIQLHPNIETVEGHVASPMEFMSLSPPLMHVAKYASNSQFYAAQQVYMDKVWS